MQIKRTQAPIATNNSQQTDQTKKADMKQPRLSNEEIFGDRFEPGFFETGLTVAGGAIAVAGALADQPLVAIGGSALSTVGAGLSARRIRAKGDGTMDRAAWVSLAAATALPLASAAILTMPSAAAPGPQGPLPQLLREVGVKALPF